MKLSRLIAPRWNKLGRDMLAHKARTVFVVLSIAVGVFAVAVMMGGRAVLMRSVDTTFPATIPSDVTYSTTAFDEHLVRDIERRPDVSAAQGRRTAYMSYRVGGGPWKNITVYAFKDYDDIRVGRPTLTPGSGWPRRGELVLETGSVEFSGLKPGDVVEFETSDERPRTLRIAGSIHDLGSVVPAMSGRAVGYVNWDSLPELEEAQQFNQLDVHASERLTTLDDASGFGAKLRDDLIEKRGVTTLMMTAHKPNTQSVTDIFNGVMLLLVVVGLLTLMVSAFLVVNTIGALIAQQVRQIGVMKAIGARRGQLIAMFFVIVLVYGVLGLLIAVPLGQLGSNWFVNFSGKTLDYFATDFQIPGRVVAIELALGLLVPLAAAAVPVFTGMRMPVRHALYGGGEDSNRFGDGLVDRVLGKMRGLPRPIALALRNTFLRKGRLALTLATLSLAAAVFIAVASVRGSILTSVELIGRHRQAMDLYAFMSPAQPMTEATRAALRVRGITAAEGWIARWGIRQRPDGTESTSILVRGLPPDTRFFSPEMQSGRWLRPGDSNEIVVDTSFVKDNPGVGVGDTVTLKIGEVEQAFRVVGVARGDLGRPAAWTARPFLDEALNANGTIEELQLSTALHDPASQTAAGRRLSDDFSARQIRVTETLTQSELKKLIRDSLSILLVFLGVLAVLLAAVGGIGLSGTMSINVLESTREIGVMRAVGASNASIYQIFITEGVLVGVVSWAIGSVLSFPLSQALTKALGDAVGFPLTFTFSPGGVALWLLLVITISVVASLLPAARAARVSVAEAIAYE